MSTHYSTDKPCPNIGDTVRDRLDRKFAEDMSRLNRQRLKEETICAILRERPMLVGEKAPYAGVDWRVVSVALLAAVFTLITIS